MTDLLTVPGPVAEPERRTAHPVRALLLSRIATGVASVILISIVVYAATLVLPGDAATAILGQQATPERLAQLRSQLHLDQSPVSGYLSWAKAALHGDFGTSLTQGQRVWDLIAPRLANSAVLIVATAIVSTILG